MFYFSVVKECDFDKNPCRHNATCIDMGSDYICKCPSGIKGRHCEIGELRQKALINFMLKSNYVTRWNIAPPVKNVGRKKRERGDTGGVGEAE